MLDSEPESLDFVAPDQQAFDYWTDGISCLLGKLFIHYSFEEWHLMGITHTRMWNSEQCMQMKVCKFWISLWCSWAGMSCGIDDWGCILSTCWDFFVAPYMLMKLLVIYSISNMHSQICQVTINRFPHKMWMNVIWKTLKIYHVFLGGYFLSSLKWYAIICHFSFL